MIERQWGAVRAAAVLLAVAAAMLGVLAGFVWAPAAVAPVVLLAALLGHPPQGAREWALIGGLAGIVGLVAVLTAASLNAP